MAITAEGLEIRRQQHSLLQLIVHKGWLAHHLPLMSRAEYTARFQWLQTTLGEPFTEFDDMENHTLFNWTSSKMTDPKTGEVTTLALGFRQESDYLMYLLKWS